MPLNKKGLKIRETMEKHYGKKKGDAVFYASENKGTIKNVTKKRKMDANESDENEETKKESDTMEKREGHSTHSRK